MEIKCLYCKREFNYERKDISKSEIDDSIGYVKCPECGKITSIYIGDNNE